MSIVWQCLAYSNSCVNPIIYNHTSKDFRDAFRGAFSTRRGDPADRIRHLDVGAADGSSRAVSRFGRSVLGQQRLMKAVDAAADAEVTRANFEDIQQQQHDFVDRNSLEGSCSRIHLEG